jgi:hypothetical protein
MLQAICEMYSVQGITYSEFIDYTEKKIQFLKDNLDSFPTEAGRTRALDILNRCKALMAKESCVRTINLSQPDMNILQ